jgi:hypothetical protein
MAKSKDPLLKKSADAEAPSASEGTLSPEGLDLEGLKALKEKLAKMRAEEDQEEDPKQNMSIPALIAYIAYDRGVNEEVVRAMLFKQFVIKDISEIAEENFQDVRRFLVDLNVIKVMN